MFAGGSPLLPTNSAEIIFCCIVVICGALVLSAIISSLSAMLIESNMEAQEKTAKLLILRKFLKQNKVSGRTAIPLFRQASMRLGANTHISSQDVVLLQLLSSEMRHELRLEIHLPEIRSLTLLRIVCEVSSIYNEFSCFASRVCNCSISTKSVLPGTQIFEPKTKVDSVYMVTYGLLQYTWSGSEGNCAIVWARSTRAPAAQKQKLPETIGSGCWLCELAINTPWTTWGMLEATHPSELTLLNIDSFLKAIEKDSNLLHIMTDYSATICELITEKKLSALSDVATDVDEQKVVAMLPLETRILVSSPALARIQSSRLLRQGPFHKRYCEAIEREVHTGRCHVVQDYDDRTLRVVSIGLLKMSRVRDGKILTMLGSSNSGESSTFIQLPGMKIDAGMHTDQQLLHMLSIEHLGSASTNHTIDECKEYVDCQENGKYGCRTRYMKSMIYATLNETAETPLSGSESEDILELDSPSKLSFRSLPEFTDEKAHFLYAALRDYVFDLDTWEIISRDKDATTTVFYCWMPPAFFASIDAKENARLSAAVLTGIRRYEGFEERKKRSSCIRVSLKEGVRLSLKAPRLELPSFFSRAFEGIRRVK